MQTQQILPVAAIAVVIYLVKIGALSAVLLALRKLWKQLAKKKAE